MDKNKWKHRLETLRQKLQFLNMAEEADLDDPIQVEEDPLSFGFGSQTEMQGEALKDKLARSRRRRRYLGITILAVVLLSAGGFYLYNSFHVFQDYIIAESQENTSASGTRYEAAGKYLYRYNSDGVACVTRSNEMQWSITYNLQAPIADVCGTTMAIAEQQGTQVYVINEEGLVGSFECLLPILKVRVSEQGVVAVVLEDGDVTWVNLYQADGTAIVSDKTTISNSGYPLDVDVSPDGQKMIVSYLGIDQGILTSTIVFYHFGSAGDPSNDYVVSSEVFSEKAIPEVYFTGNSQAVAVADDGFAVFRGSSAPEKTSEVWFEEEIVSCFYDDERIGFLFNDATDGTEYRMDLYNYRAKRTASRQIDADFEQIKIQNGQILMYNSSSCTVFTPSGRLRFTSSYEKQIEDFFYFSEFRRYLVITKESFDHIRIC